jgi:pyridoxamine 5'-phosphate oxidase
MATSTNFDQSDAFAMSQMLPDPVPSEPFSLFRGWFEEAAQKRVQPNPNAFSLATIDADGRPSVRVVLCKGFALGPSEGYIVFYTNYDGRKGRAMAANPRVAACFHWDALDRQARFEGVIVKSPAAESDAYFRSRPLESRIGAWASKQSQPVNSRRDLLNQVVQTMSRFGVRDVREAEERGIDIPRPDHWGGYRLWIDAAELWVGGPGRVHDRARWTRLLPPDGKGGFSPGPWNVQRLQP